jgi:hypothetical protein
MILLTLVLAQAQPLAPADLNQLSLPRMMFVCVKSDGETIYTVDVERTATRNELRVSDVPGAKGTIFVAGPIRSASSYHNDDQLTLKVTAGDSETANVTITVGQNIPSSATLEFTQKGARLAGTCQSVPVPPERSK